MEVYWLLLLVVVVVTALLLLHILVDAASEFTLKVVLLNSQYFIEYFNWDFYRIDSTFSLNAKTVEGRQKEAASNRSILQTKTFYSE